MLKKEGKFKINSGKWMDGLLSKGEICGSKNTGKSTKEHCSFENKLNALTHRFTWSWVLFWKVLCSPLMTKIRTLYKQYLRIPLSSRKCVEKYQVIIYAEEGREV